MIRCADDPIARGFQTLSQVTGSLMKCGLKSSQQCYLYIRTPHNETATPMSNPGAPESQSTPETTESFVDLLSQYERSHPRKPEEGKGREGTVIAVTIDSVLLDIGFKTEGILPLAAFQAKGRIPSVLKPISSSTE